MALALKRVFPYGCCWLMYVVHSTNRYSMSSVALRVRVTPSIEREISSRTRTILKRESLIVFIDITEDEEFTQWSLTLSTIEEHECFPS